MDNILTISRKIVIFVIMVTRIYYILFFAYILGKCGLGCLFYSNIVDVLSWL